MTTYNGRKMRRERTRAELWEQIRPLVIVAQAIAVMTMLWWVCHLLGMV